MGRKTSSDERAQKVLRNAFLRNEKRDERPGSELGRCTGKGQLGRELATTTSTGYFVSALLPR